MNNGDEKGIGSAGRRLLKILGQRDLPSWDSQYGATGRLCMSWGFVDWLSKLLGFVTTGLGVEVDRIFTSRMGGQRVTLLIYM